MQMTMRWFGKGFDSITLEQIRQVGYVEGIITTLYDSKPGEVWETEKIRAIKADVEAHGLQLSGIESVNIHDDIKTAAPGRDQYIENYMETLRRLGENGIQMVCYNFMPVFDWTRSDLAKMRADGTSVLSYDQSIIDAIRPEEMFDSMGEKSNGFVLPGWEPERMARVRDLFALYRNVDDSKLLDNLVYFLKAILPVCERYDLRMAIHPDDPAWPVFGLPRIVTDLAHLQKMLAAVDHPCNGVTLCTGSLGSNPDNDIPSIIRVLKDRIHFVHARNVKHLAPGKFDEAAHLSSDGSLDMHAIIRALHDIGYDGPIRPDHGRAIWGETAMPGYGLYDRALGAAYLCGLWEAAAKGH